MSSPWLYCVLPLVDGMDKNEWGARGKLSRPSQPLTKRLYTSLPQNTHSRRWRGRAGGQSTDQGHQQPMGEGIGGGNAKVGGEDEGTHGVMEVLQRGLLGMAGGGAPVEGVPVGALDAQPARAPTPRPSTPFRQGDCGPARLLWSEGKTGSGCMTSNVAWDAAYIPAAGALRACAESSGAVGPLGPMLLLGAFVHPNDRRVFFRALALALFGATSRPHQRFEGATQVIKVRVCACVCVHRKSHGVG